MIASYNSRTRRCYDFDVNTERSELVFIVRMWRQDGEGRGEREWRGSVYETESGIRFYVSGTREIADFVAARLDLKASPNC